MALKNPSSPRAARVPGAARVWADPKALHLCLFILTLAGGCAPRPPLAEQASKGPCKPGDLAFAASMLPHDLVLSPDGKELLVVDFGFLALRDPETLAVRRYLFGAEGGWVAAEFSQGGRVIVAETADGLRYSVDRQSGETKRLPDARRRRGRAAFELDLAAAMPAVAEVERAFTVARERWHVPAKLLDKNTRLALLRPRDKRLITVDQQGGLQIIDGEKRRLLKAHEAYTGRPLVFVQDDGERFWAVDDRDQLLEIGADLGLKRVLPLFSGSTPHGVLKLVVMPRGRLALITRDRLLVVYDVAGGRALARVPPTGFGADAALWFAPDRVLEVSRGEARLWSTSDGRVLFAQAGEFGGAAALSDHEALLVRGDGTAQVLDVRAPATARSNRCLLEDCRRGSLAAFAARAQDTVIVLERRRREPGVDAPARWRVWSLPEWRLAKTIAVTDDPARTPFIDRDNVVWGERRWRVPALEEVSGAPNAQALRMGEAFLTIKHPSSETPQAFDDISWQRADQPGIKRSLSASGCELASAASAPVCEPGLARRATTAAPAGDARVLLASRAGQLPSLDAPLPLLGGATEIICIPGENDAWSPPLRAADDEGDEAPPIADPLLRGTFAGAAMLEGGALYLLVTESLAPAPEAGAPQTVERPRLVKLRADRSSLERVDLPGDEAGWRALGADADTLWVVGDAHAARLRAGAWQTFTLPATPGAPSNAFFAFAPFGDGQLALLRAVVRATLQGAPEIIGYELHVAGAGVSQVFTPAPGKTPLLVGLKDGFVVLGAGETGGARFKDGAYVARDPLLDALRGLAPERIWRIGDRVVAASRGRYDLLSIEGKLIDDRNLRRPSERAAVMRVAGASPQEEVQTLASPTLTLDPPRFIDRAGKLLVTTALARLAGGALKEVFAQGDLVWALSEDSRVTFITPQERRVYVRDSATKP